MREIYLFPERTSGRDGAFFILRPFPTATFRSTRVDNSVRRAFHRIVEKGETLKMGGMFILPARKSLPETAKRYREELCTN